MTKGRIGGSEAHLDGEICLKIEKNVKKRKRESKRK